MAIHRRIQAAVAAAAAIAIAACTTTAPTSGDAAGPPRSGGASAVSGTAAYPSAGVSAPATSGAAERPPVVPAPGPAPAPTPTAPAAPAPITIAFAGDIHFERHLRPLLEGGDGLAELRPLLGAADITVVNLETSITTRGTPEPKSFTFRAPASALTTLATAGVDVAGMANNHAVDFGPVGLADTLAAKAASPIPVIGVGRTAAEAFAPAVFTVRGVSVAVVAATQVPELTAAKFPATESRAGVAASIDNVRLLAAVRAARARYDVVVVFLHWGIERTVCPDAAQVRTARALEQAGADIIVGGHQHRVLGSGWLGRAYVGYGLGNFVWWLKTASAADAATGVLTLSIDPAAVAARAAVPRDQWDGFAPIVVADDYAPLTISVVDGMPRASAQSAKRLAAWEAARGCTTLKGRP